ncbi:unnamed protein product [Closterium sp. NIES-54]
MHASCICHVLHVSHQGGLGGIHGAMDEAQCTEGQQRVCRQPHHPGQLLPRPPSPGQSAFLQAPRRDVPQVIADGDIGDNMRHLHADKLLPPGQMKRLVLCSGKIYYSLAHARRARKQWDVGLMRIEQLAPMAVDHVARVINSHSAAELLWAQLAPMAVDHVAWVIKCHPSVELVLGQEEPKNMGAWPYIRPRVATLLHSLCPDHPATSAPTPIRFVGRAPSASPATGSFAIHQSETKAIIDAALA